MDTSTTTVRRPGRRGRITRRAAVAVAGVAALVALSACTPSTDTAERKATAYTHAWFTGRSVDWAAIQCTEFVLQGTSFQGTCWAEGHEYAISSQYSGNDTLAAIYVRKVSSGQAKSSSWIKDANGNWQFFSWQF